MSRSTLRSISWLGSLLASLIPLTALAAGPVELPVKPGDLITPENAAKVADLVSPGNFTLVKQGMQMKIVATQRVEWPPPYKSATEKYSSQVSLGPDGTLHNYVAGQPFPLLDPADPQVATKVMWDFSYRPLYTDDVDLRFVQVASFKPGSGAGSPIAHFTIGHFAFYNNFGRTEVAPIPTDPEGPSTGIRYRFASYPFLEPATLRGLGLVRYRNNDPKIEDNAWLYNPQNRRVRRESATVLSDSIANFMSFGGGGGFAGSGGGATPYANNIDPDSYFGFAAKIEDFNYKFLGLKPMLASMHAETSPARPCGTDGGRSICPENWEVRQLYVIQADAKPNSAPLGDSLSIPRRVLYIDSEGWMITASDQYDREGKLWKTIATFNTYRDRPVPDARIAIWPYKRMFQTALVDENIQNGFSSVVYTPAADTPERECWYINMGTVDKSFFLPQTMERAGH